MELSKRKPSRLTAYDYSTPGAYFITICTAARKHLFWSDVGAGIARAQDVSLSAYGEMAARAIQEIPQRYPAVSLDKYVIMPNHIHLLLQIRAGSDGRPMAAPTVSTIVNQTKGSVSKQAGFPLWQKGYYDHVIRGEQDYRDIWAYIDTNPAKWQEDAL